MRPSFSFIALLSLAAACNGPPKKSGAPGVGTAGTMAPEAGSHGGEPPHVATPLAPSGAPPSASDSAAGPLVKEFVGRFVRIESEKAIPEETARSFAKRADSTFEGLLVVNAWSETAKKKITSKPFTIGLYGNETMKAKYPNVFGMTTDADHFIIGEPYFETQDSDATIAHELTHLQDWRVCGAFPALLSEGRARTSAREFLAKANIAAPAATKQAAADYYAKLTGPQAAEAARLGPHDPKHTPTVSVDIGIAGVCFVEFLRAHAGMHGTEEVTQRMAKVAELIGDKTMSLEKGWTQAFGSRLDKQLADFVAFVKATEGKRAERLKGTYWEGM